VVRVFEVLPSSSRGNYRYVTVSPADPIDWSLWRFDGPKKQPRWDEVRPSIELLDKRRPTAPFLPCTALGSFALLHPIHPEVEHVLSGLGELLPVGPVNGVHVFIMNAFPAYSCVDLSRSDGPRFSQDGRFMRIESFVFDKARFPDRSFFRPAEDWGTLLAVQGTVSPDKDFKAIVERRHLRGLHFRELWNEELGTVETRGFKDIWRTSPTS